MPGQNRARQVVEALAAAVAQGALPLPLRVVTTVVDHLGASALWTPNALRPAVLAHQLKALGIIHQKRQVDQVGPGSGR